MGIEIREGWAEQDEARPGVKDYRGLFLKNPPGEYPEIIVTCHLPWRYWGHWAVGGVHPCEGEECRHCRSGQGAQLRYVFDVWRPSERRELVWETTEAVAVLVREVSGGTTTLRGLPLQLGKTSTSSRSRTSVVLWREGELAVMRLCPCDVDGVPELPHTIDSRAVLREWWAYLRSLEPKADESAFAPRSPQGGPVSTVLETSTLPNSTDPTCKVR